MMRSISRSSIAVSSAAEISPLLRRARASFSAAGRSRLPTWSARKGGLVRGILSPHLFGHLDNHPQLRPLFLFGQHIAVLSRRKATLRREAKLIDVDEFRRLLNAALDLVAAFERSAFRRHQPEHHLLALRHETQRLKPTRPRSVELHEIAVHADAVEQHLGDRLVAA